MKEDGFKAQFKLTNVLVLTLAIVIMIVSFVHHIGDYSESYNKFYPFFWAAIFFLINVGMIPVLYRFGHSKKAFSYQVWYGVSAIVAFLIASSFCLYNYSVNATIVTTGPYLVVISVFSACSAALGWVIHVQLSNKSHRKTHTLSLLMQSRVSTEYQLQVKNFTKCFPASSPIKKEHLKYIQETEKYYKLLNTSCTDTSKDAMFVDGLHAARYLLNYFEFLAAGITKDDLDEDLLFECLSGIVVGQFKKCCLFVKHAQVDSPNTYINLEKLVDKWKLRLLKEKLRANSEAR